MDGRSGKTAAETGRRTPPEPDSNIVMRPDKMGTTHYAFVPS